MEEKRKKRIILIGASTAGKTSLTQYITDGDLAYHKTQSVQVVNQNMIDTPGEYLEIRGYKGSLMVSSTEADIVVFVQDATANKTMFPPLFRSMFAKPCVGVVTKIDIASDKQIENAEKWLKLAGAGKIYKISNVTGEGVSELAQDLEII